MYRKYFDFSQPHLPTMSAEEVAKAFTQHYYQMKDTNVDGLAGLYVSDWGRVF
jgi:hypothetical protein